MQFKTKLSISMSFENVKLIFSSHPPDRLSKMKADFSAATPSEPDDRAEISWSIFRS